MRNLENNPSRPTILDLNAKQVSQDDPRIKQIEELEFVYGPVGPVERSNLLVFLSDTNNRIITLQDSGNELMALCYVRLRKNSVHIVQLSSKAGTLRNVLPILQNYLNTLVDNLPQSESRLIALWLTEEQANLSPIRSFLENEGYVPKDVPLSPNIVDIPEKISRIPYVKVVEPLSEY